MIIVGSGIIISSSWIASNNSNGSNNSATAGSDKHFLMVESQLKPILNYMKAIIVPKYVFINEAFFLNDKIVSDDIEFRVKQLADDTVDVTEVVQELKKKREEEFDF